VISSVDQLSEPIDGTLILVDVKIERAEGGELSVARLYSDIVGLGVSVESFAVSLEALGCRDPASPEWNTVEFALESVAGYRVTEGFPRITSAQFPAGTLPEGIQTVTYSVDLGSARPFLLSDAELDEVFAKFVS
jgi:hypothetical protein